MLLIDHYVDRSDIDGLGVFSAQNVRSGDLVWDFNPIIDREIPEENLIGLPAHVIASIYKHAWYFPEDSCFWLAADGDYFMNHSDAPTLNLCGRTFVASQDIVIGQELTCDYRIVKVLDFSPTSTNEIESVSA